MIRLDDQVPVRQGCMQIFIKQLDASNRVVFEGRTEVDAVMTMVLAESRESLVRSKGPDYVEGAMSYFCQELLKLARGGSAYEEIDRAAASVALIAWLVESLFHGRNAVEFMLSNLHITVMPCSTVKYKRVPID